MLDAAGAVIRWQQRGFRGPGQGNVVVNPVGFKDGIIVPHGQTELDADVWRPDGSTLCVLRRIRLDIAGFEALPVADQEQLIGRTKATGEPLSGGLRRPGEPRRKVAGRRVPHPGQVPRARSASRVHRQRADDAARLRVRRWDGGRRPAVHLLPERLDTFISTQHRIDEQDAFLGTYGTTTASASFLIPNATSPFAASLFA